MENSKLLEMNLLLEQSEKMLKFIWVKFLPFMVCYKKLKSSFRALATIMLMTTLCWWLFSSCWWLFSSRWWLFPCKEVTNFYVKKQVTNIWKLSATLTVINIRHQQRIFRWYNRYSGRKGPQTRYKTRHFACICWNLQSSVFIGKAHSSKRKLDLHAPVLPPLSKIFESQSNRKWQTRCFSQSNWRLSRIICPWIFCLGEKWNFWWPLS